MCATTPGSVAACCCLLHHFLLRIYFNKSLEVHMYVYSSREVSLRNTRVYVSFTSCLFPSLMSSFLDLPQNMLSSGFEKKPSMVYSGRRSSLPSGLQPWADCIQPPHTTHTLSCHLCLQFCSSSQLCPPFTFSTLCGPQAKHSANAMVAVLGTECRDAC